MDSIIRSVCEEFSKGNPNFGIEFLSDDVRWHLVGEQTVVGIENVKRRSDAGAMMGFPTFTISTTIADDNRLVLQGSGVSKSDGGEQMHQFCDIFLVKEGKVAEITSYFITSPRK